MPPPPPPPPCVTIYIAQTYFDFRARMRDSGKKMCRQTEMARLCEQFCYLNSSLSSCPLAIWRKSYSSNLCPEYASEKIVSYMRERAKRASASNTQVSKYICIHTYNQCSSLLLLMAWRYTGWPRKNATTLIVNFKDIINKTELIFILLCGKFIFQQNDTMIINFG